MMNNQNKMNIYKYLKDKDSKKEGIFICEGSYSVERLLDSGYEIISILCTPSHKDHFIALSQNRCPVFEKTKEELKDITGFNFHRGVLAAARRPRVPDVEEFLSSSPHIFALVLVPSLSEPENIGSIIRSARAFSFHGLISGPGCADPFSRKAIRCSMGNIFTLPLASYSNPLQAVSALHNYGFSLVGTTASRSAKPLHSFHFSSQCVFIIGHESEGLIPPWDTVCDAYVHIDISPGVDSLNAGVAAGIFFHAFSRVYRFNKPIS